MQNDKCKMQSTFSISAFCIAILHWAFHAVSSFRHFDDVGVFVDLTRVERPDDFGD
jgi:hypothetical protein